MTKAPRRNECEGLSVIKLFQMFPDEVAARKWFEETRWPNEERHCPHCGSFKTSVVKTEKPMPYHCGGCRKYFSVRTGTAMQSSKFPMQKWVIAIYLMSTSLKGVSSMKLYKDLDITQKTVRSLAQKIREGSVDGGSKFGNVVDVDETYIGSKEKNKHSGKKLRKGRGGVMKPTSLELCAGAGGAALGLENAGFIPVAMIENDPRCCATLRQNRPYWNVIEADLKRFDPVYWHGVDLVSGGLPCPPFSIAGKGAGAEDDRDLFPHMLKIVERIEPRAVLVENVKGILSNRFKTYRDEINAALDGLGFDSFWSMFNAAEFGTPQNRSRVFLIALRRGHTKPLDWPIPVKVAATSVGLAVGDLMSANGWENTRQWIKGASNLAPTIVGGSRKHGGPDLGPTRARKQWAEMGVDGLGVANEAPEKGFRGMPRLTPRMIARLQGFPDDWVFSGAKTAQCRQIGNALPVELASAVSGAVLKCLS